jgi:hypothetical protein
MLELPRLYVNGFPKSGLHLAELLVSALYTPAYQKTWFGTNAWTVRKMNMERLDVLATIHKGEYMKGHSGYSEEMERMLIGLQIGMVFIYRDLRDVVVSQAYHILSDDEDLKHPARELYPNDLKATMKAVITGCGADDGIFERWNNFKVWMDKPWVLSIRYEELLHRPHKVAKQFLKYIISLELTHTGKEQAKIDVILFNALVNRLAEHTRNTNTVTYRKGKTKQWKYEFTPEIERLFNDTRNQQLLCAC